MTKKKRRQRDKNGAWHISAKGYPRYHSGPFRNQYVHRVRMAQKLKRKLRKDEDVHHRNGNKLDFRLHNLLLLSHKEHGWVSAKQHWYMKRKEEVERREWDEFFQSGSGDSQHIDGSVSADKASQQ